MKNKPTLRRFKSMLFELACEFTPSLHSHVRHAKDSWTLCVDICYPSIKNRIINFPLTAWAPFHFSYYLTPSRSTQENPIPLRHDQLPTVVGGEEIGQPELPVDSFRRINPHQSGQQCAHFLPHQKFHHASIDWIYFPLQTKSIYQNKPSAGSLPANCQRNK